MARRLALALAALLLAGACGDAEQPDPDVGVGTTTTGANTPSTARDATTTTRRPGSNTGRTTRDGEEPSPTSGTRADIDEAAHSGVGAFAGVLLAAGPADSLVLDVRAGQGASAGGDALNALAQQLKTLSGKPVTLAGPTALAGVGGGTHTAAEIRAMADAQGTPNRNGVAVIHVLYLAGQFEKEGVLGVAVRGDTLAIFPDTLSQATSPFVTRTRLERAVATHELGHILGLVDLYLDERRDDPDHPGHSENPQSVMYWAVETSLVGQVLGGPPPVEFDSADLADLQKIRGGAAAGS